MPKLVIVDMEQQYPFGLFTIKEGESTKVLVKQSLEYHNSNEYDRIKKSILIYKFIKHQNLVNLDHYLEEDGTIHIYFQYVPLRLEAWVCEVNPGILEKIKMELFELMHHLKSKHVKARFNPMRLGLGNQMETKYFLSCLDFTELFTEESYSAVKESINYYLKEFIDSSFQQDQAEQNQETRDRLSSGGLSEPLSERELGLKLNKSQVMTSSKSLEQQIQQSKKKSINALKKLKKLHGQ